MANYQVPRSAASIEQLHGIDANGNVVTVVVFEYTPRGEARPVFYVVQYREINRKLDPSSRVATRFSGKSARRRLNQEMRWTRDALAETRERAARERD